jgi:hypothetical protein
VLFAGGWIKDYIYPTDLLGWLDPGMDIFMSDIDDNTNANAPHPLVKGPDFDGFPAILKTQLYNNGTNNIVLFISIDHHQKVPQLWQVDIPKGDNKKQVELSIYCYY